ncbi:peroxiredoxin-6 [Homalodisca vitripennis]|uniref:1-Cys peroxiredoxin n=1 Tax=Homalodisca liturata TaxID=320908 RepID=A0A1B6HC28_9HEMI|nr:peroxiredoxin-6 [Homalodisca vitripennis]XP_046676766.1 peroxiredoxin-6 [Homalodisca vitripennis]XP_046676767.1 peroxiredoxin-6 [Homalodisca vitripennis]XP_046676768.1 peroxiredoxin-6 [Homalodisca vitripennis]
MAKPKLGEVFPDFSADTTVGKIQFHNWLGDSWGILFSHPADFTPVCTTELGRVAKLVPEFQKRNVKVIGLSCDSVSSHNSWIEDIKSYSMVQGDFPFPIIDDERRELAVQLDMLDPMERDKDGLPLTCRAVFIIDRLKRLRLSLLYPATTGRNFNEILRVVDALQLTDGNKVATPADWKQGEEVMVLPTVKEEEVRDLFPKGVSYVNLPSGKSYLRRTPQP